jgi:DNA polymerase III subunit delta'
MAAAEREETEFLVPDAGPMLQRAGVPWLAPVRTRLRSMQDRARLPHGLLLAGPPGSGQAELGAWIAARQFCRHRSDDACGACPDCRLFLAGNHPDYFWISVLPDKKEISIDQLRALSESLLMRSYRGGAKVAVIAPAEAMNVKSFNALLKTLEEPSDDTYLVLATSRTDRIPRTIASRCMRMSLPLPEEAAAVEWLKSVDGAQDWRALLELAHGAAFLAEDYSREGLGELGSEMQEAVSAAAEGRLDLIGFAKTCADNSPAARLVWLESWLTRVLKDASVAGDLVNNNRLPWLQPPGLETKIRAGFGLLDKLREARRLVGGPLNTQLLFEGLWVALAVLVGKPQGKAGE